ncbi:hypothetical protein YC2023_037303 [Brassica napus]
MRVHVIPQDPFRSIPQKAQSRKNPSREAHKFADLENFVPIPSRYSLLRTDPRSKSMVAISIVCSLSNYREQSKLKTE